MKMDPNCNMTLPWKQKVERLPATHQTLLLKVLLWTIPVQLFAQTKGKVGEGGSSEANNRYTQTGTEQCTGFVAALEKAVMLQQRIAYDHAEKVMVSTICVCRRGDRFSLTEYPAYYVLEARFQLEGPTSFSHTVE
jgi:hypothetical protein